MNRNRRMSRVEELTSALLDDNLDTVGREELNDLLRGDPDACERYLNLAEAHAALLHDHVGDELLPEFPEENKKQKVVSFSSGKAPATWKWAALAASIFLLLNGAFLWQQYSSSESEPEVDGEWVAVLSRLVDPEWEDEESNLEEGNGLEPGIFRLKSGLAQIEFFSGASVIVEGPAELSIESEWLLECRRGRLRASVPEPAQGFVIVTPDYRAVDLGTEFSLSVGKDGSSELHVVDGEVRLDDAGGNELQTLETGGAIRSSGGKIVTMGEGRGEFVDRQMLQGLAEADWLLKYRAWEETRDALRSDPATLVLFDFENQKPWDRQLENRQSAGPNAAIIGAKWTEGRWPGKGAIEFKRITDRIRLKVPGEFDALTFASWIRVEGFDRWLSSLMLTDGFDSGEVHWQISDQGEMVLGVSKEGGSPNTISPPVIHPGDLGRWIHVATTVDRKSGHVVHYLDGKVVMKEKRKFDQPFRIGAAEIGNWNSKGKKQHSIRLLNGRIDEFAILKRAMSEVEIREIYEAGQ